MPSGFEEYDDEPIARKSKAPSTKPTGTRGDLALQAGPSTARTPRHKSSVAANGKPDITSAVARPYLTPRATAQPFEPVRVIRRVQAVIEVPVKEESDDNEDGLRSDSGSEYDTQVKKTPGKSVQKPKAKRRTSKRRAESDDEDDEDYVEPSRASTARRKPRIDDAGSEDELNMGVQV